MDKEKGFFFRIGWRNIINIRYADDTVLLAESGEELQRLLDVVVEESEKKGLTINKKMECSGRGEARALTSDIRKRLELRSIVCKENDEDFMEREGKQQGELAQRGDLFMIMRQMSFLGHVMSNGELHGKFGTGYKGRKEEKQRKEKGALDVKFE